MLFVCVYAANAVVLCIYPLAGFWRITLKGIFQVTQWVVGAIMLAELVDLLLFMRQYVSSDIVLQSDFRCSVSR